MACCHDPRCPTSESPYSRPDKKPAIRSATVYEYDNQLRPGEIGVDFQSGDLNEEYTIRYDPELELDKMSADIRAWVLGARSILGVEG